jgi:hypothetical protein
MTDTHEPTSDESTPDDGEIVQQEDEFHFTRRHILKLAAISTAVTSATGGYISITPQAVQADIDPSVCTTGEPINPDNVQKMPPNSLKYIRFDGETEFNISWDDLNRGSVIDLVMQVKLDEVLDDNDDPVDPDLNDDFDEIGRMGVRVDQETGSTTVKGKDFFEKRDYIAITERSNIETDDVDVFPRNENDITRKSTFTIRITPDAPGFSSSDCMEWKLNLTIKANLGFGFYFGRLFGIVN